MTRRLQTRLGLQSVKMNLSVTGVNKGAIHVSSRSTAHIESRHENYKANLSFLIVDEITGLIPQVMVDKTCMVIPDHAKLADEHFNEPRSIDLLIGASIYHDLLKGDKLKLGSSLPTLTNTRFGWVFSGPVPFEFCDKGQIYLQSNLVTNSELNNQLQRFWSIEEIVNTPKYLSQEESECEDHFLENIKRDSSGRFIVKLPVKDNIVKLGNSEQTAMRRLRSLENKLSKNEKLKNDYTRFMDEYLNLNHMSPVDLDKDTGKTQIYYLPHHSVIKESSLTTRTRVVFDASAKSDTNLSLNDTLKVGPVVQNDLLSILLRFRTPPIVFTADITKMYRQILIDDTQRDLQRILWRADRSLPVSHFRLNTVTYGTASASFLATRCLAQIAIENESVFPLACQVMSDDFYMDDLISGAADVTIAKQLITDLISLLNKYGFPMCKWSSNQPEVFSNIVEPAQTLKAIESEHHLNKTLGILWNPDTDELTYTTTGVKYPVGKLTKRTVLSIISQLFDPLGLVGPVLVKAKLFMQQLWKLQIDWDHEIPINLRDGFNSFLAQLPSVDNIKIPRLVVHQFRNSFELHIFCDASERAYGAVAYLRSPLNEDKYQSRLLFSKSRVAPLKTLSLPRLELCAAVLGSQIAAKIIGALKNIDVITFWSDSTIVLAWINSSPSNLKTFVATRVTEILTNSNPSQWRHVDTLDNPADIISRGLDPNELASSSMWWQGPSWLSDTANHWVNNDISIPKVIPELKQVSLTTIVDQPNPDDYFKRYSSYSKLLRVTARIFRFVKNASGQERMRGPIKVSELRHAENLLCKLVQAKAFSIELDCLKKGKALPPLSKLIAFNPFLDDRGLIRVGGRLRNSNLPLFAKFPILLPNNHPLTHLIIRQEHELNLHAGPQCVVSCVRTKFWPLKCRQTVKFILKRCVDCFKANPIPISYQMGELPKARIIPSKPFASCGTDFAGPFLIRDGKLRNRKLIKAYICIFICFSSKAVHLELVSDLSTEAFLNAFKRFVSRRGLSSDIYSDNGTNYVGAEREIREIVNLLKGDQLQNFAAQHGIRWHFIPPRGPNFGGLWESAVKSVKYHLKRIIHKDQHFTFEEFHTILCQVESILNSRPLYPLSDDPNDLNPLTPGHFLIGQSLKALPEEDVTQLKYSHLSRYQRVQQAVQSLWKRWSRDYLHQLQQRTKWRFQKQSSALDGALVIIVEENFPPNTWPLGRIIKVHPGADGVVRVVTVKTNKGEFKRPATKICVLPIDIPSEE